MNWNVPMPPLVVSGWYAPAATMKRVPTPRKPKNWMRFLPTMGLSTRAAVK